MNAVTAYKSEPGSMEPGRSKSGAIALLVLVAAFCAKPAPMTLAGEIGSTFAKHDPASKSEIDNATWNDLLKSYLRDSADGLVRVNYRAFRKKGRTALTSYLNHLQTVDTTLLNRNEQFAFWVNLYNAKTVDIVLDHYPVKSIKDIDISPGVFSDGPWKKKVLEVNNIALSLDDIEHVILRGLWHDNRVHYAVNCASVGCPNLALSAYTGKTLDAMLDAGARAYINSPRGVSMENGRLKASKIYRWFTKDFGNSEKAVLAHLTKYAAPAFAGKIKSIGRIDSYEYDWTLNDTRN